MGRTHLTEWTDAESRGGRCLGPAERVGLEQCDRVSKLQATGACGRVLGHVTWGATGCRRHVKAFQAAQAVIRSSAPGCELSVTTTVPLPVSNVVLA